jgi:tetratricopeptide (TPR) repeat protein
VLLYLDTEQYYRAAERVKWAADLARNALAAMDKGKYRRAAKLLQESAETYPHPSTLRRLGICLLLDRRPADAVLYLAAAVELSSPSRRTRPRLLLAKALLTASNESRCARILRSVVKDFSDVIWAGITKVLKGKRDQLRLHRLIDELLGLIPMEHDTSDAMKDPPVDYNHLLVIYRQRNVDST